MERQEFTSGLEQSHKSASTVADRSQLNSLTPVYQPTWNAMADSGVLLNTFAHYITNNVEFIGSPKGGQFIVEAEITAIFNRAFGIVPTDTVCEVNAFSPHPCVNTKDGNPPLVDDDGFLWYDELNQKLFVSDWDDEQEFQRQRHLDRGRCWQR